MARDLCGFVNRKRQREREGGEGDETPGAKGRKNEEIYSFISILIIFKTAG